MVKGLDLFKNHFRSFTSQYVLIGGMACHVLMENAGLIFRVTKDLDIVLCIETLDAEFTRAFWDFIKVGRYRTTSAEDKRRFYRFDNPMNNEYPFMLEIFSRKPDTLSIPDGCHLTPIPIDEEISSLSAILLNDDYYHFLHSGKTMIEGIHIVDVEHLIPLKARAWLDLSRRKEKGEHIDARKIVKHKNDIFRLYQILNPAFKAKIPPSISKDMAYFLESVASDSIDLRTLGIRGTTREAILKELSRLYITAFSI